LNAETLVNTVGFFRVLQPREETKLVTPWTCQVPSSVGQLRGPPESPCKSQSVEGAKLSEELVLNFTDLFSGLGIEPMACSMLDKGSSI
jgi:hypothetical protein